MSVIIGYIVILIACLVGYLMAGGHLIDLWQPIEIFIIFGAAIGAFIVTNSGKVIKLTFKGLGVIVKPSKFTKKLFLDMLCLLFEVLGKIRKDGLMAIEGDIENPSASPVFSKYPKIVADHHIMEFLVDYLRMMVGGNLNPLELENLMDIEIETHHNEAHMAIDSIARLGDGLPAFGIVAAVMGVVHTMGSVGIPPAELGKLIGAALVGTFLGILAAYGFVAPLSVALTQKVDAEAKIYQCMKIVLLSSIQGYAPQVAVEFGRKVLFPGERPTFAETEEACKNTKGK